MRFIFASIILLLLPVRAVYPQSVTLPDREDQKPIPEVAVTDQSGTKVVFTDNTGKEDISVITANESMCFQDFTYEIGGIFLINAGIENIPDLRYRPYSSGIAAPGRNLIFNA